MSTTSILTAPRTREAYHALRRKVASMHPGVPLPPVPELMDELGVGRVTLDKAYGLLEQQGYIERKRRKGVFAADRMATGEIAIVLNRLFMESGASPSYGRTCSYLRDALYAYNPKWSVKLHLGASHVPGCELPKVLDLLEPAVLPRLRGVLSLNPLYDMGEALTAAGVPLVYLGNSLISIPRVGVDTPAMIRDGIDCLARSGCRAMCLLRAKYVGKSTTTSVDYTPLAASIAGHHGMAFDDQWIGCENDGWTEKFGYELFMRMWRSGLRPDGLLVMDDILCAGVLRAITELNLSMPDNLRLVTHASRGIDLPFSRSVTRIEFALEETADRALLMLESLVNGISPENEVEVVRGVLVEGTTT